jgi:protein O-GlcNAc transferase
VALQMLRYLGDAARAYQRALDIAASLIDAHFNLGIVFDQLGETDSAIAALEYVLKRQPARADAHRTLLDVLWRNDRGSEWMHAFQRFESRCPDALGLVANALEYYQYMGNFAKVRDYVERLSRDEFKPANELDLVDSLEQLLYLMLFFDIEPSAQASLYSTYNEAARRVYGEPLPRAIARKPGPLRIGYLSADLRDHVMGKMMLPVLREHDRSRFAIHLYSTAEAEDAVTAQFRAMGGPFVKLSGMSDDAAVRRIAEDDLDILVDLSTHTRGARPGIVARKPARVAITHVASAGALGMSAVDFKLTDRHADLPENDEFLVESLLAMEGCVYPFRRIEAAREHPFHRAALGVSDDAVIIGAFVTPLKLSRRTMALWKEILDRVPRARIAFSPNLPWLGDAYPRILAGANIDPGRAIVLPQGRDEAEGLARYELVDFVLDPTPFSNVNGTIEPLNLGIPVVTLCGRTHGERTGHSILTNLGVTSTIAMSGREYVAIAARLADDRDFRAGVRRDILARLADSPLTDMQGYARRLESAYRQAMAQTGHDVDP